VSSRRAAAGWWIDRVSGSQRGCRARPSIRCRNGLPKHTRLGQSRSAAMVKPTASPPTLSRRPGSWVGARTRGTLLGDRSSVPAFGPSPRRSRRFRHRWYRCSPIPSRISSRRGPRRGRRRVDGVVTVAALLDSRTSSSRAPEVVSVAHRTRLPDQRERRHRGCVRTATRSRNEITLAAVTRSLFSCDVTCALRVYSAVEAAFRILASRTR